MSGCNAQDNKAHGYSLNGARQVTMVGCIADSNSVAGAGTYAGLYLNNTEYCTVSGFISTEREYDNVHSYQLNAIEVAGTCTANNIDLTHSATLDSSATVGTPIMSGSASLVGNHVVINGVPLVQPVVSSATTSAMTTATVQIFTGSSVETWTLPAVSGNTGLALTIKNRGSATLTLDAAGSDDIYTTSAVTSTTVTAGSVLHLVNDGTYWCNVSGARCADNDFATAKY